LGAISENIKLNCQNEKELSKKRLILFLHIFVTSFFICLSIFLTFVFKPISPHSYGYLWSINGWDFYPCLGRYVYFKGGVLVFFFLPLKLLGFNSAFSAVLINSFFWIIFSYSLWFGKKYFLGSRIQLVSTLLLLLFGPTWAMFSPIINTDLPHIACLIFGLRFLFFFIRWGGNKYFFLSLMVLGFASSIKESFWLPGTIFVFFLIFIIFIFYRDKKTNLHKVAFLIIGSVLLGFFIDKTLRKVSAVDVKSIGQKGSSSEKWIRMMLHSGLFNTRIGSKIGRTSQEASRAYHAERDVPMIEFVFSNVRKIGIVKLLKIILYKMVAFVSYDQVASLIYTKTAAVLNDKYGSLAPPKRKNRLDWKILKKLEFIESIFFTILKFFLFFLILTGLFRFKKRPISIKFIPSGIFAFCALFSHLIFHAIVQIQPRYFIPPLIISLYISLYIKNKDLNIDINKIDINKKVKYWFFILPFVPMLAVLFF
jgi:hypothetical protein